jgi:hypothetical protein
MNGYQIEGDCATAQALTAQDLFKSEQLQPPPVPARLAALLQPVGPSVFATRSLTQSPYDLEHYLLEFEAHPGLADYAVVGFDGYGINSWAAHYYLLSEGLALFIQLPWGGAYDEPGPARAAIAEFFDWAALLQSQMTLVRQKQLVSSKRRLQVAASQFSYAGWRWLDEGADYSAVPWNTVEGMMGAVEAELDELLARKPTR